ncbi:MAG: hypothetical protein QW197_02500 [Candidatus Aenigmatarchaeota archaeon]
MERKTSLLAFLLLTLLPLVFSQSFTSDLYQTIIALSIILAIVFILFYLYGKRPKIKGGLDWGIIIYSLLIIIVFVIPVLQRIGVIKIFPDTIDEAFAANPAFAQSYQKSFMLQKLPEPVCSVFKYLAVDERIACYMPAFLYFFLLPFAAIYAITWAFLHQLKIFEDLTERLSGVLAFIIAFMTLPMGIFMIMLAIWFSFLGAFSIAIFVVMFLSGLFFRGYGYTAEAYYKATSRKVYHEKRANAGVIAKELGILAGKISDKMTFDEVIKEIQHLQDLYPLWGPELRQLERDIRNLAGGNTTNPIGNKKDDVINKIDEFIKNLNAFMK